MIDALRVILIGKAINERVSLVVALKMVAANFFFAWISPGQFLGAPAAAYSLNKNGISSESSITIASGRSISIVITSISTAIIILYSGIAPIGLNENLLLYLKGFFSLVVVSLLLLITLVVFRLERYLPKVLHKNKYIGICIRAIGKASLFYKSGKKYILPISILSLLFNITFVGILIYFSFKYNVDLSKAIAMPVLYLTSLLLAPTPGGAGVAEATAVAFFPAPFNPSQAIMAVLVFRSFTFIFQLMIGFSFLFFTQGKSNKLPLSANT